jgi:hypothetical protein
MMSTTQQTQQTHQQTKPTQKYLRSVITVNFDFNGVGSGFELTLRTLNSAKTQRVDLSRF